MIYSKRFMEKVVDYVDNDYNILAEELKAVVDFEYYGDFDSFLKKEVLNEDYGFTKGFMEDLYERAKENAFHKDLVAASALLMGEPLQLSQKQPPYSEGGKTK